MFLTLLKGSSKLVDELLRNKGLILFGDLVPSVIIIIIIIIIITIITRNMGQSPT